MEPVRCSRSAVAGPASETTQWHDAVVLYCLVHTGQDTHRINSIRSRPRVHPPWYHRSEERRVGKDGRSRGGAEELKNIRAQASDDAEDATAIKDPKNSHAIHLPDQMW